MPSGFIGLQDAHSPQGHYIEYRNIRLKDLDRDSEAMEDAGLYAFASEYADDELEMAQDYFDEMKKFYAAAAAEGDAVLLLIL